MFHFGGYALRRNVGVIAVYAIEFPHSEIPGSQVANHLPEAYRRHATSFIASISQGILHLLIKFLSFQILTNKIW